MILFHRTLIQISYLTITWTRENASLSWSSPSSGSQFCIWLKTWNIFIEYKTQGYVICCIQYYLPYRCPPPPKSQETRTRDISNPGAWHPSSLCHCMQCEYYPWFTMTEWLWNVVIFAVYGVGFPSYISNQGLQVRPDDQIYVEAELSWKCSAAWLTSPSLRSS